MEKFSPGTESDHPSENMEIPAEKREGEFDISENVIDREIVSSQGRSPEAQITEDGRAANTVRKKMGLPEIAAIGLAATMNVAQAQQVPDVDGAPLPDEIKSVPGGADNTYQEDVIRASQSVVHFDSDGNFQLDARVDSTKETLPDLTPAQSHEQIDEHEALERGLQKVRDSGGDGVPELFSDSAEYFDDSGEVQEPTSRVQWAYEKAVREATLNKTGADVSDAGLYESRDVTQSQFSREKLDSILAVREKLAFVVAAAAEKSGFSQKALKDSTNTHRVMYAVAQILGGEVIRDVARDATNDAYDKERKEHIEGYSSADDEAGFSADEKIRDLGHDLDHDKTRSNVFLQDVDVLTPMQVAEKIKQIAQDVKSEGFGALSLTNIDTVAALAHFASHPIVSYEKSGDDWTMSLDVDPKDKRLLWQVKKEF